MASEQQWEQGEDTSEREGNNGLPGERRYLFEAKLYPPDGIPHASRRRNSRTMTYLNTLGRSKLIRSSLRHRVPLSGSRKCNPGWRRCAGRWSPRSVVITCHLLPVVRGILPELLWHRPKRRWASTSPLFRLQEAHDDVENVHTSQIHPDKMVEQLPDVSLQTLKKPTSWASKLPILELIAPAAPNSWSYAMKF